MKEAVFSLWNGQLALKLLPALFTSTPYAEMTSTISNFDFIFSMSLTNIFGGYIRMLVIFHLLSQNEL